MIKRSALPRLLELARQFQVVSVMGPRQSGKTTLVREAFPDYDYVNLENPDLRRQALGDGASFLKNHPGRLIIDEVQYVPELLSRIQVAVDEHPREKGRFVITGSHQPKLREGISQSLAGRVGILTLLPLSVGELSAAGLSADRDELLFRGFMPRVWAEGLSPFDCYENYLATYVERDVNLLVNVQDRRAFEVFLRVLAGRAGQLLNCNSIAADIGVSVPTIKRWVSVLEASYVVHILPAYYGNFGKRFVKTPKIYFTDVGLLAHLLGIREASQVSRDPLFGGLFENMVVMEAVKSCLNRGEPADWYFLRDRSGLEVDLVRDRARRLSLFEIKGARAFSGDFAKNLVRAQSQLPNVADLNVVYAGEPATFKGVEFRNFAAAFDSA